MSDIRKKIDQAIKFLRSIPQDTTIELCYSGGKDSDVILRLAQMAGIPFDAIYKNTTIDPPGTIAHCKENGVRVVKPVMTFNKVIERAGLPKRYRRFCCAILKEYKIHERAILGIRRDESIARKKRYQEPEQCRNYSKSEKVRQYFPILYWSLDDVVEFIEMEKIRCAPCYYDDNGVFHPNRRLGCLACPMQRDNGFADYKQYPKLLKAHIRAIDKHIKMHPQSQEKREKYGLTTGCHEMFHRLFCYNHEEYRLKTTGGLFPETAIDPKTYLEKIFGIEL